MHLPDLVPDEAVGQSLGHYRLLERTGEGGCGVVYAPRLIHLLKGDLDWIVMKCVEKDRTRRYDTMNGLAADLKRHLTNEPVVAPPPSTTYKLQKAFRGNKLAFTAATAVVAAWVIGLGAATIMFLS